MCEPKKRLGRQGPDELLDHRFFQDIDWRIRQHKAPFIPNLDSETDLKYFDSRDDDGIDMQKTSSLEKAPDDNKSVLSPKSEKLKGFTFKRENSPKLRP